MAEIIRGARVTSKKQLYQQIELKEVSRELIAGEK